MGATQCQENCLASRSSPWLISAKTVPTTSAVLIERRRVSRSVQYAARTRKLFSRRPRRVVEGIRINELLTSRQLSHCLHFVLQPQSHAARLANQRGPPVVGHPR